MAVILFSSHYVENVHARTFILLMDVFAGADDTASVLDETRLFKNLLNPTQYDVRAIPKYQTSSNVTVTLGLTPLHLVELLNTKDAWLQCVSNRVSSLSLEDIDVILASGQQFRENISFSMWNDELCCIQLWDD